MMPCPDCGRTLGGIKTYEMHRLLRSGRCRTDAQLRRMGICPNARGLWVRRAPGSVRERWLGYLQLRLFPVRGRKRKVSRKIRVWFPWLARGHRVSSHQGRLPGVPGPSERQVA